MGLWFPILIWPGLGSGSRPPQTTATQPGSEEKNRPASTRSTRGDPGRSRSTRRRWGRPGRRLLIGFYYGVVVPDLDLARVRKWVDGRNAALPSRARGLIRYEINVSPWAVTVLECRPPWSGDMGTEWTRFPICRFRYTKTRSEWSLLWRDRNLRFHVYDLVRPTPHIDELIREVERDPTCIFWG